MQLIVLVAKETNDADCPRDTYRVVEDVARL